jgi:hypothetical protein
MFMYLRIYYVKKKKRWNIRRVLQVSIFALNPRFVYGSKYSMYASAHIVLRTFNTSVIRERTKNYWFVLESVSIVVESNNILSQTFTRGATRNVHYYFTITNIVGVRNVS